MVPCRVPLVMGLLSVALVAVPLRAALPASVPAMRIDGLGKGAVSLDGLWQFHLGDEPAWALPQTPDYAWERLTADQPWGAQGHRSYTGYAWYRKHVNFSLAPGIPPEVYLLMRRIDNVYEIYWNGQMVGRNGVMPPNPSFLFQQPAQIVNLGPVRSGVLAIRVWKQPLISFDSGLQGGFYFPPAAGSLDAIQHMKNSLDYAWMRGHQYAFGLQSLYGLVMLLSLFAWLRNRSQRVLLATIAFSGASIAGIFLGGLLLPFSFKFSLGWLQPVLSFQNIGLWYLLLYLLGLDGNRRLARYTRNLAVLSIAASSLDGLIMLPDWSQPGLTMPVQIADAILTGIFTATELYPLVLVILALRKRLDFARWFLAIAAFCTEMLAVVGVAVGRGSRFALFNRLASPLFQVNGNAFTPQVVAHSVLLIAVIYAVYRYMQQTLHRQGALEQEFQSARELQQVLIPDTPPAIPGFAVTSAYYPAHEVGGDFFQIIPLDGQPAGSTLILIGDVSGKGMRAAMTVSFIVGVLHSLAKFVTRPAEFLAALNQILCGRLQGGFATCIALRLDRYGRCTIASAGHPAPYLNQREISLPGALPLGVLPGQLYSEGEFELQEGDHFALYTDGLVEARNKSGEIFSFDRLNALFASHPGAAEAGQAAVTFGQDDDITVLTLTRLSAGEPSSTELTAPDLARTWTSFLS